MLYEVITSPGVWEFWYCTCVGPSARPALKKGSWMVVMVRIPGPSGIFMTPVVGDGLFPLFHASGNELSNETNVPADDDPINRKMKIKSESAIRCICIPLHDLTNYRR